MTDGIKLRFSAELESAITTPHEHEDSKGHPPLWVIWAHRLARDGLNPPPAIDSVYNSEDTCRYNLGALLERSEEPSSDFAQGRLIVFVERIPANHRFASSLDERLTDYTRSMVRFYRERGG